MKLRWRNGWSKNILQYDFSRFFEARPESHLHTLANFSIPIVHDSQYFLKGTYPRPLQPPSRIFLSYLPISSSSTTYVAHIDASVPRDEHVASSLIYIHVDAMHVYARCCRAERKDSRLSFPSNTPRRVTAAGIPRSDIWRRQNFDAPFRPRTRIWLVHHMHVHLSSGIGVELSRILTTVQHGCAYGWRESHCLSFR